MPRIRFEELPDTITPEDYANWRGIGKENARTYFHRKGFPRLLNAGNRLIADKRAVLFFDLGLNGKDMQEIISTLGKNLITKEEGSNDKIQYELPKII